MALDPEASRARNSRVIEEFRRSNGQTERPIVLLHTLGARTGQTRVTPVLYQRVGDALAVFASAAGDDDHPAWYHNLLAHPEIDIEIGSEQQRVRARVAAGEERSQIWERQIVDQPVFVDHQAKTTRQIPVILLEPVDG